MIPQAVCTELSHADAPEIVRTWIANPPMWLKVVSVSCQEETFNQRLHPGELEAILLAKMISANLVILDEKIARQVAKKCGLKVIGLLGILQEAATRGWIDLGAALDILKTTNFRVSSGLLKAMLHGKQA
jgi:predicted nucleic acid-binding protein